ncbi:MHS family MFS transporter [Helcobacillus sp. ACRRO]|uniref:MFS transporter n=1 Tax=Helcobacillus sp. ACRRO TaxID=2918202 RepID=UPI001EF5DC4A|nr:MFS transporter [Helcobacillus sp. ACRRO]MCG7427381.1 MHS family MFS transporter [Helcobacillus sp. ACRRO]
MSATTSAQAGSTAAADPAGTAPAEADRRLTSKERRRVIIASLVGTTIEFYDFYIYATAAVAVLPALFFLDGDDTSKLLASMATFGAAFIARPLGSIVFGHFGDRIGRKATLIGALLTMGIATFLIGLLPTAHQIGLWAPAMLTILRFTQGLGLGGEWSGASLLATEYAEEGRRGRAAMWPQLGAPFGFILANGFFLVLTVLFAFDSTSAVLDHSFLVWGWRVPFLASLAMVLLGLWVRVKLEETPVFQQAVDEDKKVKSPVTEVFRTAWLPLIQGTFIMLATYVVFYLMTAWVLSYGIAKPEAGGLGISYTTFLIQQLLSVLLFAAFIPVSGWAADRFGRRRSLSVTTALIVVFGLLFTPLMDPAKVGVGEDVAMWRVLLFLSLGMMLMGLSFGSMSALLPELFATNVRYTGSGIAYNVASILGAAITPFIAVWLNARWGVGAVGAYLSLAGVITFVALRLSPETRARDMREI